jgi:hypothetical protein
MIIFQAWPDAVFPATVNEALEAVHVLDLRSRAAIVTGDALLPLAARPRTARWPP